jgi:hypothetical protein
VVAALWHCVPAHAVARGIEYCRIILNRCVCYPPRSIAVTYWNIGVGPIRDAGLVFLCHSLCSVLLVPVEHLLNVPGVHAGDWV